LAEHCEVCGESPARKIEDLVLCDRCARVCKKILEAGERGVSMKEIEEIVRAEWKERGELFVEA